MAQDITNKDRALLNVDISILDEEPQQILDQSVELNVSNTQPTSTGVQRFTDYSSRYGEIYARAKVLLGQTDLIAKDVSVTPQGETTNLLASVRRVFHKNTTNITYEMYKHCLELRAQLLLEDSRSFMNTSVGVSQND